MIIKKEFKEDLYGKPGINTRYYGNSVKEMTGVRQEFKEDAIKYLNCSCITRHNEKGVIIGFEDNKEYRDYYYIVYIPELNGIRYELANSVEFTKTIV